MVRRYLEVVGAAGELVRASTRLAAQLDAVGASPLADCLQRRVLVLGRQSVRGAAHPDELRWVADLLDTSRKHVGLGAEVCSVAGALESLRRWSAVDPIKDLGSPAVAHTAPLTLPPQRAPRLGPAPRPRGSGGRAR